MTPILLSLLLLFLASSLYAMVLSTPTGRAFTRSKTWVTVVVGCALILGAFALYWPEAGLMALVFFAAGGLPIVVKELVDEFRREMALMNRHMTEE